MTPREQMRASDADRERVAERLREAVGEGRLTLDECDERLRGVWAAKTFGELDQFLVDLPAPATAEHSQVVPATSPKAPVPPSRHEPTLKLPRWIAALWGLWLAVVLVNLVIWFLVVIGTGELVYFWPMWVAGPWGAVNLALTIVFPPRPR